MRHLVLRSLLVVVLVALLGSLALRSEPCATIGECSDLSAAKSQVLGVADSIENMFFKVAIPATFEDTVTFNKPIIAPDLITSLAAGDGITITAGEIPRITNTGVLELVAGTGISVDGNKITSTITQGYTSLVAGTNISIDGNKITSTYTAPTVDYALSGWTDNGTSVTLTTTTDSVTVGTLTTGAITATSLTTSGLALAGGLTVTSGNSLLPDTDLGSDVGSASKRFNNLWVANINSNSSQSFSGQSTFSYSPTDATLTQGSVIINPTTSVTDGQLLGLSIAGYQRAFIDEDGDIVLGYNSATSAPATDYPLNIYGHSGTRVSFTDTSGNAYFAGNVGVGTTNPFSKLHVYDGSGNAGTIAIGHPLYPGLLYVTASTGEFRIDNRTSSAAGFISFYPNGQSSTLGTEAMRIATSGNVGIGTTAPGAKLDVVGNGRFSTYLQLGTSLLTSNGSAAAPSHTFSSEQTMGMFRVGTATLGLGTNSTERLRIDSSGNVGIGTTAPTSKLHVTGAVTGKALAIFDETGDQNILVASASGVSKFTLDRTGIVTGNRFVSSLGIGDVVPWISGPTKTPAIRDSAGSGIIVYSTNGEFESYSAANRFDWYNGQTYSKTNHLMTLNSGSLGIGTTAPTSKLHVSGAVTGKALSIFNETGDQALLTASASGVTKFTIDHSGNVGIGITPTYALDVKAAGTGVIARFASDNSTLCTLATDGTLSCTSDRSLKKNIDTISYGLSDVMKLNPVAFNWNFSSDQEIKSLGFIAQDIETVIPGLVTVGDNGLRSLNTIGLVPVLARAIQEQQLEIDEIKLSTGSASITQGEWSVLNELVTTIENIVKEIQTKLIAMSEKISSKEIHTPKLCVGESDDEICLTKDQVKSVLDNLPSPTASASASPTPTLEPSPSASASVTPNPSP